MQYNKYENWFSGFSTSPKALSGVWVCGSHNSRSELNRNMWETDFQTPNHKRNF